MRDLHVTIATGMAADLADLLCARTRAFGVAVARYRHRGDLLTRAYAGEQVHLPVAHCVSCTLREVLPRFLSGVAGRHDRLLLILPEIADPLDAATAIDTADVGVRIDTVIAEPATIARELGGGDSLADRGIAGAATDGRTVASVLARQAETTDLFLTWVRPHADPFEAAIGHSLLTHLSPWARSLDLEAVTDLTAPAGKPAFDLHAVHERMQPGGALPGCPYPGGPVSTLIWRSRRPFHPERLYAALEPVLDTGDRARPRPSMARQPPADAAVVGVRRRDTRHRAGGTLAAHRRPRHLAPGIPHPPHDRVAGLASPARRPAHRDPLHRARCRRHRPAPRTGRGGPHRHRDDRRRTRLGPAPRPVHTLAGPHPGRTRHSPTA